MGWKPMPHLKVPLLPPVFHPVRVLPSKRDIHSASAVPDAIAGLEKAAVSIKHILNNVKVDSFMLRFLKYKRFKSHYILNNKIQPPFKETLSPASELVKSFTYNNL
jgi:hypothetical protein